jgi:hypothetical protein
MIVRSKLSGEIRAWWATLTAICLLGAAVAYGVTWYRQGELEREATRDARRLVVDSLQPVLTPADLEDPIRGERYEQLAAEVDDHLLGGPINVVVIWRDDGTILFADDPARVGQKEPEVRDEIHAVAAGTSEGMVDGERFRVFTSLRVGEDGELAAVEVGRSHAAIVAEAQDPWYPWVKRGLILAVVFAALYVATGIFFAVLGRLDARSARAGSAPSERQPSRAEKKARPAPDADLPAYMQPGFQEEMQARRRVEEELEAVEKERDSLRARVRHLESELESQRARPSEPEPEGDGHVVPLSRR